MSESIHPPRRRRRQRIVTTAVLSVGALAMGAGAAAAAPTDVDRGFGTNGRATIDAGGEESLADLALAPDGKIVGVGATSAVRTDALVFRVGRDGRPDESFDGDGIRSIDSGGAENGNAVAIQPDGKVLVAGTTSVGGDAALYRVNVDGSLDRSFDGDGARGIDSGGVERIYAIAQQPDGKIVAAGYTSVGLDAAVYRLNPDGSPDQSFDGDGARGLDSGGAEAAAAVAVQPDGKIVIAGYTSVGADAAVYRLNPDGSLDKSFDGDGAVGVGGVGAQEFRDVAVQPDGKLVLVGETTQSGDALVARLTRDGAPDPTFGPQGVRTIDNGATESAEEVALTPDGKILASGATSAGSDALVFRLNADGSRDTTFAPDGVFAFGGSALTYGAGLALQPDGGIVLAGTSDTNAEDGLVYRLLGDGRPEQRGGPLAARRCAGARVTIVGTNGRDRIRGTRRRDVIAALGGNDRISALGGDDLVCGGRGNDVISGGEGRDALRGEGGADRLLGGPGRDRLFGGVGRDRLVGGAGRDFRRQ